MRLGLLALALAGFAAAPALAADAGSELQDLRQHCIAAAESTQQDERDLLQSQTALILLARDAAATERGLKETRAEQAQLLAALARLARNPPEAFGIAPETPLDRIRTGLLVPAAGSALGRDAQALAGEFARLASLRQEIAKQQDAATLQRENLKTDYASLAELTARRGAAAQKLGHTDASATARLGEHAADLRALIAVTDAEADKNKADKKTDPTRPKGLRVFDAAAAPLLHPPVTGPIARRFGAPDGGDKPSEGLGFSALPGAVVVAPFDGRIDYAGRFRDLGLILIIRHGGGYHSVLAGLDRSDAKPGDWVLAGEPVGAMPDLAAAASGTVLKFELRRDGNPVDPFPSLIDSDKPAGQGGAADSRVRE
jgi:septal ring factor EnvC (AmiA/AmiB activator)